MYWLTVAYLFSYWSTFVLSMLYHKQYIGKYCRTVSYGDFHSLIKSRLYPLQSPYFIDDWSHEIDRCLIEVPLTSLTEELEEFFGCLHIYYLNGDDSIALAFSSNSRYQSVSWNGTKSRSVIVPCCHALQTLWQYKIESSARVSSINFTRPFLSPISFCPNDEDSNSWIFGSIVHFKKPVTSMSL